MTGRNTDKLYPDAAATPQIIGLPADKMSR
jgi:hypothetical protein